MKTAAWTILAIVFTGIFLIQCSGYSVVTSKSDLTGTFQGTYTLIYSDYIWPGTRIPVIGTFTDSSWTLTVDGSREIPPGVCMCIAEGWYRVFDSHISLRLVSIIAPLSWCEVCYPCVGHDGLFLFDRSPNSDTLKLSQYSETEKLMREVRLVRSASVR